MNKSKILLGVCLALFSFNVFADTPDVSIANTVNQAIATSAAKTIMPMAIKWLSAFMTIQFLITNIKLITEGSDIDRVVMKCAALFSWFGFCWFILFNGPTFIDSVGTGVFSTFASNVPTPSSIIAATLALCSTILVGIAAIGTTLAGFGNGALANVLVIALFFVFGIGMYMAIKVYMITLELGLIVVTSPVSFSFLGMNALRDQGIAPFKSLISLTYRIILLGIICSAFSGVINVASDQLNSIKWSDPTTWGSAMDVLFSVLCAYPFLAVMLYKSDAIAGNLAGGGSSLGVADVASAAAAGAAAGAAVVTGGASAAAGAGKAGQPIGDLMKGLMGSGGGSVSNASSSGAGPAPIGPAPAPPSMSMGTGGQASGNKPPVRPTPAGAGINAQPGRPNPTSNPKPSSSGGSGTSAGIGAPPSSLEQQVGDLVKALNQPKQEKGVTDHLSALNQHVAGERAPTHVSINSHHSD
jgi:type IV secretion system protein TrbL